MRQIESLVLRTLAFLMGMFSVVFLCSALLGGITPEVLLCPVLAMLCYAALHIERQLAEEKKQRKKGRPVPLRVVSANGPQRAA